MLLAGSEDGLYRLTNVDGPDDPTVETALDTGAVMRIRSFDVFDGVFAATTTGLYHSPDGHDWTDLDVPETKVYSVGAAPDGRLYAGTRPAHVYVAETGDRIDPEDTPEWRELDGFQELPSREEWRLPRHDDLAQVRDVHVHPDASDRVIAGVEVGGVHLSEDGGETWTERRGEAHDDVHELTVLGPEEFVAATGFGLFRTTDAGRSWTRLDEAYDQRYFRSVAAVDGAVYAGAAMAHTSTWDEDDADPELFVFRDGGALEPVAHPRDDATVTGITAGDDGVLIGTHRGAVLRGRDGDWSVVATLPVSENFAGSYTPLLWVEN
ncbi:WD40/YVTN/BNR-like repeat-containing protein [Natronomonas sp.]|uniref:WD40/YVTN/BNR-like repeat-containing protein n=1 Tax=Natronomonas sp. TaxID=2184060 RepID=UPI002FC2D9C1